MYNVKIHEPLGNSDHNQIHVDINVKSESKNKKSIRETSTKVVKRKFLAKLDWNNMLMNKTAIECWNILKYEIESIIDTFVTLKNQGKLSRKKQKQTMWRRTRKNEDYANYKEALNAATTEIRQFKRKLACNIKQ